MRELGAPAEEVSGLAEALPSWEPFPEARTSLEEARSRGWKLAILSNTDRDFIDASMERIGVPFELAIVASEIGSYKPGHLHWSRFFEATAAPPERHVHVAQSYFHDIVPANELGLRSIWINRYGERHEPPPTRELEDLSAFPTHSMSSSPPEGFRVRPASVEDAPAINELAVAVDTVVQGWSDSTEAELVDWWRLTTSPGTRGSSRTTPWPHTQ